MQNTAYMVSPNSALGTKTPLPVSYFAQIIGSTTVHDIDFPPPSKIDRSFDGGTSELMPLPSLFGKWTVPACDVIQEVRSA